MRKIVLISLCLGLLLPVMLSAGQIDLQDQHYARIFNNNKNYAVTISVSDVPTGRTTSYPPKPGRGYQTAIGSGFIFDSLGHIITTASVTDQGNLYKITFADGTTRFAEIVGLDLESGISVLKVNSPPFEPPQFAKSNTLVPGHWIGVIGNFFGMFPSFATGVVSGQNDNGNILVTADISPGSAGGLVVNSQDQIVGMIAFKLTEAVNLKEIQVNEVSKYAKKSLLLTEATLDLPVGGFSLIISAEKINRVAAMLIATSNRVGGYLGVIPEDLDVDWARRVFNINYGVYLITVENDSPAYRSGIREGDILLEFAGHRIKKSTQLRRLIFQNKPHSRIKIKFLRGGRIRTVSAILDSSKNAQLNKSTKKSK